LNIKDKASKLRQLKRDETYQDLIEGVKQKQVEIFTSPHSAGDDLEKAHGIICALSALDDYMNSVFSEEAVWDKRNK